MKTELIVGLHWNAAGGRPETASAFAEAARKSFL